MVDSHRTEDHDLSEPLIAAQRPLARTTNEDVRQKNLSTVLQLVHGRGALSRTEIGARTGLTRSTVTALVQELLDLNLVCEASVERTGRAGRPSLGVAAEDRVVALSVSAEPHSVSVALVGLGGAVHSRVRHDLAKPPSPRRFAQVTSSLIDGMRADIDRHYRLVGAGVAVPGLVDRSGTVLLSPSLGWRRENLARRLTDAIGVAVSVGNDTSVGALVETRFGVARDVDNVLYLSGSMNGIGGGLVLDGALVRGTSGFAGEFGHTVVNTSGALCSCGRRGCLQVEVHPAKVLALLGRRRLDEDELDIELGLVRDPVTIAEVARQVDVLSVALTNFVNAFAPQMVVLSGYLGVLLATSRERLAEAVRLHPVGAEGRTVRLERAHMRSHLMQIAPAELAFEPLLDDPVAQAPRN